MKNISTASLIITYILTRVIFKLTNFKCSFSSGTFNIQNFVIDFGLWIIIYTIVYSILKKCFKAYSKK